MESTMGKSASRLWREQRRKGLTTLSFSPWITREKEKMSADGINDNLLLVDRTLNDSVHTAIKDAATTGGLKTETTGKTIFGINKTVFIVSALLLTAGTVYLIIQTGKK